MKRFFVLSLALIMLVSFLPVLGMGAEVSFDLSAPSYTYESTDATKVKFEVTGNSATLSGNMARAAGETQNFVSVDYTGIFTSKSNVDEYVTQTVKIDEMPIYEKSSYNFQYRASGYFNTLTRNYGTPTALPIMNGRTKDQVHDSILYSIFRKDADGNLGLKLYCMSGDFNYVHVEVPKFAEKIGEAFTLTTIWHADNKVSFICDGEDLGTFDNVTFTHTRKAERKEYLSIGYETHGTKVSTYGEGTVKLTVSDVKITHGHTHTVNDTDGNCLTTGTCTECGNAVTMTEHTPAADDGDCSTPIRCSNSGCTQIVTPAKTHTPGADDGDCSTDILCSNPGCNKVAVPASAHTPAADDGDCTTAVMCSICGKVATPAMSSHQPAIANFKYATKTEAGYTGDTVCYVCGHEFSKGEVTPMLAGGTSNDQAVNDVAIYVYIAIGAVVLVAAAVVVILVIRKKQNRKEQPDSV